MNTKSLIDHSPQVKLLFNKARAAKQTEEKSSRSIVDEWQMSLLFYVRCSRLKKKRGEEDKRVTKETFIHCTMTKRGTLKLEKTFLKSFIAYLSQGLPSYRLINFAPSLSKFSSLENYSSPWNWLRNIKMNELNHTVLQVSVSNCVGGVLIKNYG